MFPYFRKTSYILTLITLIVLVSALFIFLYWKIFDTTLLESILLHLVPLLVLYCFSISSWFLCINLEFKKARIIYNILYHLLSSAFVISIWIFCASLYVNLISKAAGLYEIKQIFQSNIYFIISTGLLVYLVSILIHYLVITANKRKEAEVLAYKNDLLKTKAELKFLKASIHPHFLFNSLNLLTPMINKNPKLAKTTLDHLSEFLLYSLRFGKKEHVTIGDEIDHIKDYLAIEKLRLQERLKVIYQINKDTLHFLIPPLTMLPVLENAVKHGIEQLLDGGNIHIKIIKLAEKKILMKIQNPYPRTPENIKGSGLGLYILKKRLKDFFGSEVLINIQKDHHLFCLQIKIPLKEKP